MLNAANTCITLFVTIQHHVTDLCPYISQSWMLEQSRIWTVNPAIHHIGLIGSTAHRDYSQQIPYDANHTPSYMYSTRGLDKSWNWKNDIFYLIRNDKNRISIQISLKIFPLKSDWPEIIIRRHWLVFFWTKVEDNLWRQSTVCFNSTIMNYHKTD